jgi:hypothetical protein
MISKHYPMSDDQENRYSLEGFDIRIPDITVSNSTILTPNSY